MSQQTAPFESIRRTNPAGNEFWSSRDFAKVLGYNDDRNFEAVVAKARTACFNSGQRVEDHFVGITEMIEIGSGAQRPLKSVMMRDERLGGGLRVEFKSRKALKKGKP